MAERPIIFSTPMVQAILDGRKTQTRRVIKPQPIEKTCFGICEGSTHKANIGKVGFGEENEVRSYIKTPYQPDDVLWVRETWCQLYELDGNDQAIENTEKYYYAADGCNPTPFNHFPDEDGYNGDRGCPRWKPSIHMPRAAARIFLRVKDVRVERVQDISVEDVWREGIDVGDVLPEPDLRSMIPMWDTLSKAKQNEYIAMWAKSHYFKCLDKAKEANRAFSELWDSLNAKRGYGWDENPWVWVYEFERIAL